MNNYHNYLKQKKKKKKKKKEVIGMIDQVKFNLHRNGRNGIKYYRLKKIF
jgi:hypothetical protein